MIGGALVCVLATAGCSGPDAAPQPTSTTAMVQLPQVTDEPSPSATGEPLLTEAPDPYSTVGAIVDGFPPELTPTLDGLEILQSSARPGATAGTADISLNVRTTATADELLATLSAPLLAAGFTQAATTADPAVAHHVTFTRAAGVEILVIVILDTGDTRTATMGGTVTVAAS